MAKIKSVDHVKGDMFTFERKLVQAINDMQAQFLEVEIHYGVGDNYSALLIGRSRKPFE